MSEFEYVIVVSVDTKQNADQVIAERIYFDEDYGFDYSIREK